jgi:hypothetical protein
VWLFTIAEGVLAQLSQRLVQLQHQLESVTARAALDKDVYDGELNAMKNAHTLQLMEKDQQIAYLQVRHSARSTGLC